MRKQAVLDTHKIAVLHPKLLRTFGLNYLKVSLPTKEQPAYDAGRKSGRNHHCQLS